MCNLLFVTCSQNESVCILLVCINVIYIQTQNGEYKIIQYLFDTLRVCQSSKLKHTVLSKVASFIFNR